MRTEMSYISDSCSYSIKSNIKVIDSDTALGLPMKILSQNILDKDLTKRHTITLPSRIGMKIGDYKKLMRGESTDFYIDGVSSDGRKIEIHCGCHTTMMEGVITIEGNHDHNSIATLEFEARYEDDRQPDNYLITLVSHDSNNMNISQVRIEQRHSSFKRSLIFVATRDGRTIVGDEYYYYV